MSSNEEIKKNMRKEFIYKALEDGWTVKKDINKPKTFEFTKGSKIPVDDSKHQSSRRSISAPISKSPKIPKS